MLMSKTLLKFHVAQLISLVIIDKVENKRKKNKRKKTRKKEKKKAESQKAKNASSSGKTKKSDLPQAVNYYILLSRPRLTLEEFFTLHFLQLIL